MFQKIKQTLIIWVILSIMLVTTATATYFISTQMNDWNVYVAINGKTDVGEIIVSPDRTKIIFNAPNISINDFDSNGLLKIEIPFKIVNDGNLNSAIIFDTKIIDGNVDLLDSLILVTASNNKNVLEYSNIKNISRNVFNVLSGEEEHILMIVTLKVNQSIKRIDYTNNTLNFIIPFVAVVSENIPRECVRVSDSMIR